MDGLSAIALEGDTNEIHPALLLQYQSAGARGIGAGGYRLARRLGDIDDSREETIDDKCILLGEKLRQSGETRHKGTQPLESVGVGSY